MTKKNEELAKTGPTALVASEDIPDWMLPDQDAVANIAPEDSKVPRLSIAQGLSPQVIKNDPKFIEGLRNGDAFNDLTQEVYGDGPIQVIVIRADKPRWIEFDEDRQILERDIKPGDPRTLWKSDPETRKRIPPVATQFFDYVVLKLPELEPMLLSFKSTGIDTATTLNGLIRNKPLAPMYGYIFELTPKQFNNDQGSWTNFVVKPVNQPPLTNSKGIIQDKEVYERVKQFVEIFKEKKVEFGEDNPEPASPSGDLDDDTLAGAAKTEL